MVLNVLIYFADGDTGLLSIRPCLAALLLRSILLLLPPLLRIDGHLVGQLNSNLFQSTPSLCELGYVPPVVVYGCLLANATILGKYLETWV